MTPEEFRTIGHRVIDWIADYRTRLAERPVMAHTAPGEVKDQLAATPPELPEGFDAVFRDLEQVIVPGLTLWKHPLFFGYFPANAALASVLTALFLLSIKGWATLATGSVAMLGSLIDSGLDLLASLVTFWGVRFAAEPADDDHRSAITNTTTRPGQWCCVSSERIRN